MPDHAHLTSSEAIEFFRATLIAYITKTRPLLEDACDEVFRTREWLHDDRRIHWEHQVRKRTRVLEEARQALLGAKMSNLRETRAAEHMAVERAKRALVEAEEKLKLIKTWSREFDQRAQILVKELEHVRSLAANELPRGVAHLSQIVLRVEEYAGVVRKPASQAPANAEIPATKESP